MKIKRKIYYSIAEHLDQKEITILAGPRQIGKTTLMEALAQKCDQTDRKYLWLNLDVEEDFKRLETQRTFLLWINLMLGDESGVIFIDEIQRKENAGKFIKGIYDTNPHLKFVLSGSGSMELKEKIIESLAGRKRVFDIFPISFDEFIDYKSDYKYSERLQEYKSVEYGNVTTYFEEYVSFGGYPAVVTTDGAQAKRNILVEILNSYLVRDVRALLNIKNYSAYAKLFKIIGHQVGMPVKYTQLSQYVSLSARAVKEYIWYLRHTYMVTESSPYFSNPLKELVKEPTLYYYDLGMLNLQRNNLVSEIEFPSFGFVFQNFIYNELKILLKDFFPKLKYWRSKDKAEVDIILDLGFAVYPVEIKFTAFKKPAISRSFRSYINRYQPKKAFLITRTGAFEMILDKTKIYFIPFYKLEQLREELTPHNFKTITPVKKALHPKNKRKK